MQVDTVTVKYERYTRTRVSVQYEYIAEEKDMQFDQVKDRAAETRDDGRSQEINYSLVLLLMMIMMIISTK